MAWPAGMECWGGGLTSGCWTGQLLGLAKVLPAPLTPVPLPSVALDLVGGGGAAASLVVVLCGLCEFATHIEAEASLEAALGGRRRR